MKSRQEYGSVKRANRASSVDPRSNEVKAEISVDIVGFLSVYALGRAINVIAQPISILFY